MNELKRNILEKIKNSERGIFLEDIKKEFGKSAEEIIMNLLEEGRVFEPRPGILKYLG